MNHYDFSGRTARRHCAEILRHLGFRRMTQTDRRALSRWISDDLCAGGQPINAMLEHVFLWCRDRRIYGPSRKELERLVRSQRHLYLEALLARVRDGLRRMRSPCWKPRSPIPMARPASTREGGCRSGDARKHSWRDRQTRLYPTACSSPRFPIGHGQGMGRSDRSPGCRR
ncbi:DUF4158 domain-containing protein, partial [Novosphingobium sp. ST904]|uniref:DUF4158 domain-containing protein n=1 Tax=Novosphingobium sp. ST904 TaxID=1684385 RepID=UPI001E54F65C